MKLWFKINIILLSLSIVMGIISVISDYGFSLFLSLKAVIIFGFCDLYITGRINESSI